ncbi:hypothetical protein [Aquipuribacter hungaricus]|uniref:RiboL-PSP-HEPN domain-containing protein n=1 Tax=Aquipuribacter hungaricus TaxID=545624 RepID=A0ABV7WFD9_9MICO
MRLRRRALKNGLSVTAFACFEVFIRERLDELLVELTKCPTLPDFDQLPEALQMAATKGVVDALRFQLNQRRENLDTQTVVALSQRHAGMIASTAGRPFELSDWSFGWASSNVGPGVLVDFLNALKAPKLYSEIPKVLQDVDFDYAAAGLADGNKFALARLGGWRHAAAHDATASVDLALLRTRITSYLSVAFAFDLLASFAMRVLVDEFSGYGEVAPDRNCLLLRQFVPVVPAFELQDISGGRLQSYYAWAQCRADIGELPTPLTGAVFERDVQGQIVDWFFH